MNKIVLENSLLKATFIPRLGMKLSSLIFKPKNKEVFFQPTKGFYSEPKLGEPFENFDTSGCDDMLPTIDSCLDLPDHGEVWSSNVEHYALRKDEITFTLKLKTMPLKMSKIIRIKGSSIVMDYKIENLSDKRLSYIWALHPLNVFDESTELIIDCNDNILNVKESEILGNIEEKMNFPIMSKGNDIINLSKLNSYNDGSFYKFYFNDKVGIDKAGLRYNDDRVEFLIHYDNKFSPYLGIWINKGGFKGEHNVAIEPSTAFYDDLNISKRWSRESYIEGRKTEEFTIRMELKEIY